MITFSVFRPTPPESISPEFLRFLQQRFNADFRMISRDPDGSIAQDLNRRVFGKLELRTAAHQALTDDRIEKITIIGHQGQMYAPTIARILACSQAVMNGEPIQGKNVIRRPEGYLLVDTVDPNNSLHALFHLL